MYEYPNLVLAITGNEQSIPKIKHLLQSVPTIKNASIIIALQTCDNRDIYLPQTILQTTEMDIEIIKDADVLESNKIYINRPGDNVELDLDGFFKASFEVSLKKRNAMADTFLRSVASSAQDRAIGIKMSDQSEMGLQGLQSIKEAGGITVLERDSKTSSLVTYKALKGFDPDIIGPVTQINGFLPTIFKGQAELDLLRTEAWNGE